MSDGTVTHGDGLLDRPQHCAYCGRLMPAGTKVRWWTLQSDEHGPLLREFADPQCVVMDANVNAWADEGDLLRAADFRDACEETYPGPFPWTNDDGGV